MEKFEAKDNNTKKFNNNYKNIKKLDEDEKNRLETKWDIDNTLDYYSIERGIITIPENMEFIFYHTFYVGVDKNGCIKDALIPPPKIINEHGIEFYSSN
ncbi:MULTISPECIES: hypothetical protein [unclassified Lebetimonas]|uniref:hypothetical protein n=1 Tax=unclassified Lebetimonas TaxID=2648158 RepID=UPI0004633A17|nr:MULTISPECIES: hypothetical protein [unclassified Lebetimonas]